MTSSPHIWDLFFRRYYHQQIINLAKEFPDQKSLYIQFSDIDKYDPALSDELLASPRAVIVDAEHALAGFDLPIVADLAGAHVRVIGVPGVVPIRDLRSDHNMHLVVVDGLIRMATEVRPKLCVGVFECQGCSESMVLPQQGGGDKFIEPFTCSNEACGRRGPFRLLLDKSEFIDAQKLRIQESPEDLRGGEQPQTLDINLESDLVGIVSPGDHITVTGILRSYQRVTRDGKSCFFDIIIDAVSIELRDKDFSEVEISEDEERQIIELGKSQNINTTIIQSIAPSIYGYEDVKEGLALQIMSGVTKDNMPDGTRIRGDVHVLLVGDPGIAKSQLLRYMIRLSPRGIYTSGRSSSGSGLTASAVKSDMFGDGRWTLEAGALVLADHGLAAIDEMDKMRPEDRSAIHEAAEQQRVSIAKAGIIATLKSRCSILGAANPKQGRFDPYVPIAQQIDISPTLLSRFDLIYIMPDEPNTAKDTAISNHILSSHRAGELYAYREAFPSGTISTAAVDSAMDVVQPPILPDLLRKYVAYAKKNVFPVMDDDVTQHLINFYLGLRKQGEDRDAPVPVTARQLEALVRLCEASARIRLDNHITIWDAERVVRVVESCLRQVAFDKETGLFDTDLINTGVGKSQRDTMRTLRNIIRDLADEHGGIAPEDDVMSEAMAAGIDTDKTTHMLEKLQQQGEIYSPTHGGYKPS